MKQRILTLATLACMLLTLAACGGGQQAAAPTPRSRPRPRRLRP